MTSSDRRLLLVHAHPDDETSSTGGTMARYAADGVAVTLLTCTLGELGEVVLPELATLAADAGDQLGGYRVGELALALRELGVTDNRFLGGPARFRDSGMMGQPGNDAPRAFWRAASDPDVMEAAVTAAATVIRDVRPQVLVTYDENGGYGHPDHIMAHRVAMAGVLAAADPASGAAGEPWQVEKVYWVVLPMSVLQKGIDMAKAAGLDFWGEAERAEDLGMGCPDADVTTAVDARAFAPAKTAALRAHATQIAVDSPFFTMMAQAAEGAWSVEHYRLVRGTVSPDPDDADGRETDLFAGIG